MEQIKDILPNITANSLMMNNSHLSLMVQKAIATSQVNLDLSPYSLILHIPATKLSAAEPYLHQIMEPFGGYNASPSDGNWCDLKNNLWCPEPIVLVKSYMALNILQQNLTATLQHCYTMGKAIGERAIALEIITNNAMLLIPTNG